MPVLEILGANGEISSFAPHIIYAATCYPEDDNKRLELIATSFTAITLATVPDPIPTLLQAAQKFPWLIPSLHRAPEPERVRETASQFTSSSWLAGDILLTLLNAATCHPELNVNVTKAVAALSRAYHGGRNFKGGTVQTASRTVWEAWRRFRRVAHFHAVRQMWIHHPERGAGSGEGYAEWTYDHFLEYIATAEELRRQAVDRRFISHEDTWRLPGDLRLPNITLNLTGGLLSPLYDLIRDYKPEHSSKP